MVMRATGVQRQQRPRPSSRSGSAPLCSSHVRSASTQPSSVMASFRRECQRGRQGGTHSGGDGDTPTRMHAHRTAALRCAAQTNDCHLTARRCHSALHAHCRYTHEYGEKKEKFNQSLFLVFFQCIGNAAFAFARTNTDEAQRSTAQCCDSPRPGQLRMA